MADQQPVDSRTHGAASASPIFPVPDSRIKPRVETALEDRLDLVGCKRVDAAVDDFVLKLCSAAQIEKRVAQTAIHEFFLQGVERGAQCVNSALVDLQLEC